MPFSVVSSASNDFWPFLAFAGHFKPHLVLSFAIFLFAFLAFGFRFSFFWGAQAPEFLVNKRSDFAETFFVVVFFFDISSETVEISY